jgi:ribosome-associated protein
MPNVPVRAVISPRMHRSVSATMPAIVHVAATDCHRLENPEMTIRLEVRGEYIQLDQLLKTTGLCHSGGFAHAEIEAGQVRVDGAVENRKRAKLRPGQKVEYGDEVIELLPEKKS